MVKALKSNNSRTCCFLQHDSDKDGFILQWYIVACQPLMLLTLGGKDMIETEQRRTGTKP